MAIVPDFPPEGSYICFAGDIMHVRHTSKRVKQSTFYSTIKRMNYINNQPGTNYKGVAVACLLCRQHTVDRTLDPHNRRDLMTSSRNLGKYPG